VAGRGKNIAVKNYIKIDGMYREWEQLTPEEKEKFQRIFTDKFVKSIKGEKKCDIIDS
jgi:hypothetical protein